VAAGSRGIGFWVALPASPTGLSVGQPDLPRRTPLREFKDNVAHSNRSVGLNVDDGPMMDGTTETTNYSPRLDPANESAAVIADFTGLRAYKNSGRGVWLRGSNLRVTNAVLADNGIGATFAANETFVQNSTFIGESDNVGAGLGFYRGYEFYDGRVGADNVKFINFTKVGTIPSSALGQNRNNAFPISTGNFARGLTFINANEVYFEDPHADKDGDKAAAFYDSTGSVTGAAGNFVVANVPFMVDNTCAPRAAWNSHVCTGRRVNLRINNNGPEAAGPFTLTRDDGAAITLVGVPNTQTTGTTTALPGRSYVVSWGGAVPPKPRIFINRTQVGEWARMTVPYPTANIRVIRDYNTGQPVTQSASVAEVDNATGAAWYYEAATGLVHLKLMTNTGRDYAAMFIEPLSGRGREDLKETGGPGFRSALLICALTRQTPLRRSRRPSAPPHPTPRARPCAGPTGHRVHIARRCIPVSRSSTPYTISAAMACSTITRVIGRRSRVRTRSVRMSATTASAAARPHQRPTGPMEVRKPNARLSGIPKSQKPARLMSIGARVSPAPRRMPAVTAWVPSKS